MDLKALPSTLPIVRMIEPGLIEGMTQFVRMSVIALHRHLPGYISCQRRAVWRPQSFKPAAETCVGFLGLGVLAKASIDKLRPLGFRLLGWSRSDAKIKGVDCYAGADGLPYFLRQCSILVCLLPLMSDTAGILDARLFSQLPSGACLINCGRGGHLDANALLEALDSRQLSAAFLDMTDPEPLSSDSPLWAHEGVLITPHIASMTRPETAVGVVLDNIRRHRQGLPMTSAVQQDRGY